MHLQRKELQEENVSQPENVSEVEEMEVLYYGASFSPDKEENGCLERLNAEQEAEISM